MLLYSEINLICIIMLTILFVRAKGELQSEALCRRTKQAIFWCFMLIVTDLMWFLMSQGMLLGGMPELTGLKSIYFLSATVVSYYMTQYFSLIFRDTWAQKNPFRVLAVLPVVAHMVLIAINLWKPILFSYTIVSGKPHYERGDGFLLNYVFSAFYFTIVFVPAIVRLFKPKYYAMREQILGALVFTIAPLVAALLQLELRRIPFLCFGVTIGVWIQYMNQLSLMISRDTLTGLNNRRQIIRDLDKMLNSHGGDGNVAVMMVDIDFFKGINDRFGHEAGDAAIVTAAEILKKAGQVSGVRPVISRYGGDEFVIVMVTEDGTEPTVLAENIREIAVETKVSETGELLQFSIGIGTNEGTDDMQTVLKRADKAMYENKRKHHAMRV